MRKVTISIARTPDNRTVGNITVDNETIFGIVSPDADFVNQMIYSVYHTHDFTEEEAETLH